MIQRTRSRLDVLQPLQLSRSHSLLRRTITARTAITTAPDAMAMSSMGRGDGEVTGVVDGVVVEVVEVVVVVVVVGGQG